MKFNFYSKRSDGRVRRMTFKTAKDLVRKAHISPTIRNAMAYEAVVAEAHGRPLKITIQDGDNYQELTTDEGGPRR